MSSQNQLKGYKKYIWIVKDSDMLGGKLAIRGTRLSVAQVLESLACEWTYEELVDAHGPIPKEAFLEVLQVASELAGRIDAAA